MKSRTFTTKIGMCNEMWLADILKLSQGQKSVDLSDDKIGIELKSRLEKYHHNFAVHHYQLDQFKKENPDLELFWAFMIYGLKDSPKKIKTNENLEEHVLKRETWILPREWVMQFEPRTPKTGPYVYIHKSHFPNQSYFKDYEIEKGIIHVPKNSSLEKRLRL